MTERFKNMELLIPFGALGLDKKDNIPSPEDFNEWLDLNDRKLYVNQEITEDIVDYIAYYIQRWNEEDMNKENKTPIRMYINTVGGSLLDTLHVCDIIMSSKTPVYTVVQTCAYSAGVLLTIAGHKRFAYPHSSFLVHRGSFGLSGDANANYDTTEFYNKMYDKVREFMLSNTDITEELLQKNMRKEWYMFAEDALELGIIDSITKEII